MTGGFALPRIGRFGRGVFVAGLLACLAACASPPGFVVVETYSAHAVSRPMIEVRRGDGRAFLREDWMLAEATAQAHCARKGMVYDRLPPSPDYTQMRLENGVFSFMARCRPADARRVPSA